MNNKTSLKDLYSFPGFRALVRLKDYPEHPGARVVTLLRRKKNDLSMWTCSQWLVRQPSQNGSGSELRRHTDLPGV